MGKLLSMDGRAERKGSSLGRFFGGVDRGDEDPAEGAASLIEGIDRLAAEDLRAQKQLEPIFRFEAFLESDLQFGDKIRLAMGIVGFMDVGADRGRGALELTDEGRVAFDRFTQPDDLDRKIHRQLDKFVFLQMGTPRNFGWRGNIRKGELRPVSKKV